MITTKCIRWRKNSTNYYAHLHTTRETTPSLCCRVGGQTLYCPLEEGTQSNALCMHRVTVDAQGSGGAIVRKSYYAVDKIPVINTYVDVDFSPQPYSLAYKLYRVILSLNEAINNKVVLQMYNGYGGSWVSVAELPAGSTYTDIYYGEYDFRCTDGWRARVVVYNSSGTALWTSSERQSDQSWISYSIPEGAWGV